MKNIFKYHKRFASNAILNFYLVFYCMDIIPYD